MKIIPNFSQYMATEEGDLYSTNYKKTQKLVKLKPAKSHNSYLKTILKGDDNKYHSITVHSMIALTFIGKRPLGYVINHINGIKADNNVKNLEYCTHSYNCKHSFDMGLQLPKRGILNGNSKLKDKDILIIRNVAANGGRYYGRKKLAEHFGISEAHIKDIVNQRRGIWSHVK